MMYDRVYRSKQGYVHDCIFGFYCKSLRILPIRHLIMKCILTGRDRLQLRYSNTIPLKVLACSELLSTKSVVVFSVFKVVPLR